VIAPEWEDPRGVPISAILFGGRRASAVPFVTEARTWAHGTFQGSIMASVTTAAATGAVGELRRDPMAMLPFCGYHMGDYFAHWLKMGERGGHQMPRIFYVNWFRKGPQGKFLWPGYGENSRVLKWIFERCDDRAATVESAIGLHPTPEALDTRGLDLGVETLKQLLVPDPDGWRREIPSIRLHLERFGTRLPPALAGELSALERRLGGV
jgi:phosphoenolpyruvate carboxykinase (GTP)